MDTPFRTYTQQVTSHLRHVTPQEKATLQEELEAHLEDHTEALLAAGWTQEQAQHHALAAMGDPKAIGTALNQVYPLRWLVLSRAALVLIILFALILLLNLPTWFLCCYNSLTARWDALHSPNHVRQSNTQVEDMTPLDTTLCLPNGDILSLFAVLLVPQADGTYEAQISGTAYNRNPFRTPYYSRLEYAVNGGAPIEPLRGTSSSVGALYWAESIRGLKPGDTLRVQTVSPGFHVSAQVPLPWKEVSGP